MGIYTCDVCKDKAYRELNAKLNELIKKIDKRVKFIHPDNEMAKITALSILSDLEHFADHRA